MFKIYIAEALGSFIFFSIVLTYKDPIYIAIGLLIGILIASIASQASQPHLNPAVTTMVYLNGNISGEISIGFIGAQLFGAFAAVQFIKYMDHKDNV
jgi:hypothetical protein